MIEIKQTPKSKSVIKIAETKDELLELAYLASSELQRSRYSSYTYDRLDHNISDGSTQYKIRQGWYTALKVMPVAPGVFKEVMPVLGSNKMFVTVEVLNSLTVMPYAIRSTSISTGAVYDNGSPVDISVGGTNAQYETEKEAITVYNQMIDKRIASLKAQLTALQDHRKRADYRHLIMDTRVRAHNGIDMILKTKPIRGTKDVD